jgi:RNA polymerase sigma factor (sigma-70 family)
VNNPTSREDLIQEALTRILEKGPLHSTDALIGYAAATARNLVITQARTNDVRRRNLHRLLDASSPERPDDRLVRNEEIQAIATALARMPQADRGAMVAHEVFKVDTQSLARTSKCTPGALAVRLARARARMRVEYLVALRKDGPPSESCRRVLTALSGRDRRRQLKLDAIGHVAECDYCAGQRSALADLSGPDRSPLTANG